MPLTKEEIRVVLPRSSMDPELLEGDPNGYRVIPVNSPEWIALRSQAS